MVGLLLIVGFPRFSQLQNSYRRVIKNEVTPEKLHEICGTASCDPCFSNALIRRLTRIRSEISCFWGNMWHSTAALAGSKELAKYWGSYIKRWCGPSKMVILMDFCGKRGNESKILRVNGYKWRMLTCQVTFLEGGGSGGWWFCEDYLLQRVAMASEGCQ